jgi:aspartyl-tRNA(Asn)/glutamyl-tRNA(Gln) amidotransferase subunit B
MRSKEEANDYRYFPDPDLLPVQINEAFIDSVRATLPELPDEKAARFAREWGLSAYDAGVLSASRELGAYFEAVATQLGATHASHGGPGAGRMRPAGDQGGSPGAFAEQGLRSEMATQGLREAGTAQGNAAHAKLAANWVMGELSSALNRDNVEVKEARVLPGQLSGLLARIVDQSISGKIAKEVFEAMWSEGKSADAIIEAKGLKQITDSGAIEGVIDAVIAANPKQLADYRSGKDKLFGFFVGQVMKATEGKANPAQLNELLKLKLGGGA